MALCGVPVTMFIMHACQVCSLAKHGNFYVKHNAHETTKQEKIVRIKNDVILLEMSYH